MNTVSPGQVLERLGWRYAVKKFDGTKKIPQATWSALEQAMVLAPSSFGLQPWRFVVVDNPGLRARLREVSWGQSQITDASHLVVLARKSKVTAEDVDAFINRIVEVRKAPAASLAEYRGMMLGSVSNPQGLGGGSMEAWTARQVYIALGFLLSAAALVGVDACPMEGFDASKYDEILGLPAQGYNAAVVATLGYRAADDWLAGLPKVRARVEEVVKHV